MQKQKKLSLDISLCHFTTEKKNSPLLIWQWLVMKIWIFYDKRKTSKQWLDHSEGLKAPSKANVALKEDYVYGSWLQVLSISLFQSEQQNKMENYCHELRQMHWKLCNKQFAFVNQQKVLQWAIGIWKGKSCFIILYSFMNTNDFSASESWWYELIKASSCKEHWVVGSNSSLVNQLAFEVVMLIGFKGFFLGGGL